jgi:hypothetical protein
LSKEGGAAVDPGDEIGAPLGAAEEVDVVHREVAEVDGRRGHADDRRSRYRDVRARVHALGIVHVQIGKRQVVIDRDAPQDVLRAAGTDVDVVLAPVGVEREALAGAGGEDGDLVVLAARDQADAAAENVAVQQ